MNDTETIQRARGWRECEPALPDPLADTSEGWWEFGQILKWAEEQRHRSPYLPWRFDLMHYGDGHYASRVWLVGNRYTAPPLAEAASSDFRAAIISVLAAAVRHESEASHDQS